MSSTANMSDVPSYKDKPNDILKKNAYLRKTLMAQINRVRENNY